MALVLKLGVWPNRDRYFRLWILIGLVMSDVTEGRKPDLKSILIDLAIESWRLSRLFQRLVSKQESSDGARYSNQLRYFQGKVEASLKAADCRLVNLEGQLFEEGFPATALNIGDFGQEDELIVDQMLEPIVMGVDGVVRRGSVLVKRIQ